VLACFGAITLAPRLTVAQRSSLPVVAYVSSHLSPIASQTAPQIFIDALRALGWEDGRNVVIEFHTAEGRIERAQAIFADLVARKVSLIYTAGGWGVVVMPSLALKATRTIPIVFVGGGSDPVASGIVASLARPGGNITGFMVTRGADFALKRLELLKEMAPHIKRVAFLGSKEDFELGEKLLKAGASKLGLVMVLTLAVKPEDLEPGFEQAKRERADAMFVSNLPMNRDQAGRIAALAARYRLPAEYFYPESVDAGGLAAYGVDILDLIRRAAGYIDRILRGTKPADLPVEQPSKFTLVINLKTARALGLTVPQAVLLRADRVIE
jgi:putative ABC transport system substrate-binding protein